MESEEGQCRPVALRFDGGTLTSGPLLKTVYPPLEPTGGRPTPVKRANLNSQTGQLERSNGQTAQRSKHTQVPTIFLCLCIFVCARVYVFMCVCVCVRACVYMCVLFVCVLFVCVLFVCLLFVCLLFVCVILVCVLHVCVCERERVSRRRNRRRNAHGKAQHPEKKVAPHPRSR